MSKGPKNVTTTAQTTINPTLLDRQNTAWGAAGAATNQQMPMFTADQRFAGFTPAQLQAFGMAQDASTAGVGTTQSAVNGLGQMFAPGGAGMVDPNSVAGVSAAHARDVAAQTGLGNISQYYDPYQSGAIDAATGAIERARQDAASNINSQAAVAGAFGGSRSGVAESLTNRDYAQQQADTAASMANTGWMNAAGLLQNDQNRDLQAQGMNQNADLTTAGQQMQGDIATQNARLAAAQGNQSAGLQGIGLMGQLGNQQQQMGAFGANLMSQVGGQQQALAQAQKDFAYNQSMAQYQQPYQNAQFLQGILSGQQYGGTNTTTQPNPNAGSLGSTLGGLAGTALGAYMGGPMGASMGGQAGSAFGNWLYPQQQQVSPSSMYGANG